MTHANSILPKALEYHEALPPRIRAYLNGRGIADTAINRFLIGHDGKRITIPIYDRSGRIRFFKLRRDPDDRRSGPKMLATKGSAAELYGWEHLRAPRERVIICEGELDRLVLESRGFAAVTSTGGAGVFKREWALELERVPAVYVCFDRDQAGRVGAHRVASLIDGARIVELPEEVGDGGDVTDFFARLGRSAEDFESLLGSARAAPKPTKARSDQGRTYSSARLNGDGEIAKLKGAVPIERIVGRVTKLQNHGHYRTGRCPFHEDRTPSFVVYPLTASFYCFGCSAHGDALDFLQRTRGMSFPEAVEALRLEAGPL